MEFIFKNTNTYNKLVDRMTPTSLDERGVSIVLGAVLLITIAVVAFFTYYPILVTGMIRDREGSLMREVESSFSQLKSTVEGLIQGGVGKTISFPMSIDPISLVPEPRNASGLTVTPAWTKSSSTEVVALLEEFPSEDNLYEKWRFENVWNDIKDGPENYWSSETAGEGSGSAVISSENGGSLEGEGYWRTTLENWYIWSPSEVEIEFCYMIKCEFSPEQLYLRMKLEYPDGSLEALFNPRDIKGKDKDTWHSVKLPDVEVPNPAAKFNYENNGEKGGVYGIWLGISYKTPTGATENVEVYFDNVKITLHASKISVGWYGKIEHEALNSVLPPQTHVYETGAVIRVQDSTGIMISEPSYLLEDPKPIDNGYKIVLNIFTIAGTEGNTSRTTEASVAIASGTIYEPGWLPKEQSIEIKIKSDYPEAWESYLAELAEEINDVDNLSAVENIQELSITVTADENFYIYYGTRITSFNAKIS